MELRQTQKKSGIKGINMNMIFGKAVEILIKLYANTKKKNLLNFNLHHRIIF